MDNPLLKPFETPHGVPPFSQIEVGHYLEAFRMALLRQKDETDQITSNPEHPDFYNTIEALERSGLDLDRVAAVFFNLLGTDTNDEMQQISNEIAPELSRHQDSILMNAELFQRIRTVYESDCRQTLTKEEIRLLEETYKGFVRGGALLSPEEKEKLSRINEELSVLTLTFGENVLAETNGFKLWIEHEEELDGLPSGIRAAAAEAAQSEGMDGKWLFTLHRPSFVPFMQNSRKRNLREKLFRAYISRANQGNEHDNKEIINKIVNLRIQKARIFGKSNYAEYVLQDAMAKHPSQVEELLEKIWKSALPASLKEASALREIAGRLDGLQNLEPWDWWYYAEKLRKEKYDLDDESLRPYFQLDKVIQGAFDVASELYGIQMEERTDLPLPHPEARCFSVKATGGKQMGLLYMDFHPRPSKEGGAWMSNFREQWKETDKVVLPIVTNVFNFTRPTTDRPSLLNFDEVTTLFHEFGHALHSLLSECNYKSLSGTNVPRDFVELPSQFMENWAFEPEILRRFAYHYQTGHAIPETLIEKIRKSRHFNQGFATVEYLSAAFLDLHYHLLDQEAELQPDRFEREAMEKIGMLPEIVTRYRSTFFNHIFSGGYSAGYYSYIWSEVLDADAYEAFKENGLLDPETAQRFKECILSRGNTEDPMDMFVRFRGRKPDIQPLLAKRGLLPVN